MFQLILRLSFRVHGILQVYAPANVALRAVRSRRGLKWGALAMFLAVPYLFAARLCVAWIDDGGPGWLNLVVVVCIWNAMRFVAVGPVSFVMLARSRVRERRSRSAGQNSTTPPTAAAGSR